MYEVGYYVVSFSEVINEEVVVKAYPSYCSLDQSLNDSFEAPVYHTIGERYGSLEECEDACKEEENRWNSNWNSNN